MFVRLWNASSLSERLDIASQISDLNPDFAQTYQKLQKGRTYLNTVPRGFVEWQLDNKRVGKPHFCLVFIPYGYTPNKKYTTTTYAAPFFKPPKLARFFCPNIVPRHTQNFDICISHTQNRKRNRRRH